MSEMELQDRPLDAEAKAGKAEDTKVGRMHAAVRHLPWRLDIRWRIIQRRMTHSELRNSELFVIFMAACAGAGAGIGVLLLRHAIDWVHHLAFGVPEYASLTDNPVFSRWHVMAMLTGGGLVVGLAGWLIRRWRPGDIVDAIEANALYGGRMSLTDSVNLGILTLLSGGFGASVGLEAAYTQLGSGIASRVGRGLRLRRVDMRTLVGCGAAAAIAAAYNAPLAGAFYAFELILGSYTLATLAPVVIAALCGTFTARLIFGAEPVFVISQAMHPHDIDYWAFILVGAASGGLGILTMHCVTRAETLFRRFIPWRIGRPMLGGVLVGLVALIFPQVLGSGHGAIRADLTGNIPLMALLGVVAAKIFASAVSIGAGFRGGLFSSSLFLGSLFGSALAIVFGHLPFVTLAQDPLPYTLVGMGAVAASIVGAPITMILLVLETTGDFTTTIGVTIGVITASIITRRCFGYSFATWRFHLRGLKIRGAEDIGWTEELRVGRLMRSDSKVVAPDMSVSALRKAFPLGSTKQIFVVAEGALRGMIELPELHSPDLAKDLDTTHAEDIVEPLSHMLVPGDTVRTALDLFSTAHVDTLPVVDNAEHRRLVGYLSEHFALRRYNEELEKRRSESGDASLYSRAAMPGS